MSESRGAVMRPCLRPYKYPETGQPSLSLRNIIFMRLFIRRIISNFASTNACRYKKRLKAADNYPVF